MKKNAIVKALLIVNTKWILFTNYLAKIVFREQKIERLCRVVGNELPQDPDETYELTTDNVKKMMAIYMRFR